MFLLIVVYYKSFALSGIVLLGSFLSIVGVILGHWIMDKLQLVLFDTHFFLTATSLIGFISLMGISARSSLLLIDFTKSLIAEGMEKKRAIAKATAPRSKPILLTAIAIVLGSLLLATDPIFGGLGISLIFGSIASTLVSLFFIPILMEGVEFPSCFPERIEFISAHNAFEFGRNSFSIYMDRLIKDLKRLPKKQNRDFVKEVIDELDRERLLVLFSQDFTSIDSYLEEIKRLLLEKFNQQLYKVSVPSYLEDEEEYFSCIAKDSGLSYQSKKANDWYRAMREKLRGNTEPILLLVTDLEDGNEQLDRKLATRLRSLKEEFTHFYTICVGRKALAKLVYGEAYLSPLNNAKEIFFPEDGKKLSEDRIVQQFNSLGKDLNLLCKYLKREELGRFATWSHNKLIRTLFWKNLLVKKNRKFVWRDELTREIGREVLGCDENMV